VPPDVQAYLADLVDAPRKAKGRPAKHPGQLEYDQLREAGDLFAAIQKIRSTGAAEGRGPFGAIPNTSPAVPAAPATPADQVPLPRLSEAMACKEYAEINKLSAKSVVRRYQAAKKKLRATFERVDGDTKYFLTHEDHIAWEKANLKKETGSIRYVVLLTPLMIDHSSEK
jgi:hypothetical protein